MAKTKAELIEENKKLKAQIALNYFGCADDIDKSDARHALWAEQRATRGFDNTELWNFDYTLASYILPRLKVFAEKLSGYPGHLKDLDEWEKILATMIEAFEILAADFILSKEKQDKVELGLNNFRKYFHNLWS